MLTNDRLVDHAIYKRKVKFINFLSIVAKHFNLSNDINETVWYLIDNIIF